MPNKYVHKSLASMNEKSSTLFIELTYILFNASMYSNYDLDFIFFT